MRRTAHFIVLLGSLLGVLFSGQLSVVAQESRGTKALAYEAVDLSDGVDLMLARASAIDLAAYPIIPANMGLSAEIFQQGQRLGRDQHMLSKMGDCNSVDWLFLHPFGVQQYDLGMYEELAAVIEQFQGSFDTRTYAGFNGLNAQGVSRVRHR
jgi:hypothetical protein